VKRKRKQGKTSGTVAGRSPTPIRAHLREESSLQPLVEDGLGAVESSHRGYLAAEIRPLFADSLNLDEGVRAEHAQSNRWDYLLGHGESGQVIGVEPHSARSDQVSVVIAKRDAAKRHLRGHLRPQVVISEWIWVASGRVDFAPYDRAKLRLDQAGIRFVGGQVKVKDLKGLATSSGNDALRRDAAVVAVGAGATPTSCSGCSALHPSLIGRPLATDSGTMHQAPQQCRCFLPEPQAHGWLGKALAAVSLRSTALGSASPTRPGRSAWCNTARSPSCPS
jgi:hypothetical protein